MPKLNGRYGWVPDLPDQRDHLFAAPAEGNVRSSPATGATPPDQLPATLQWLSTAPVHVRVAATSGAVENAKRAKTAKRTLFRLVMGAGSRRIVCIEAARFTLS